MKNALMNAVAKLPSPKGRFGAIVFMGLTLLAPAARAQATYNYTGNVFQYFSCGPASPGPGTEGCLYDPAPGNLLTSYTATDKVTATLTFDAALPANMPLQDVRSVSGFQLTLNDGHQTLTSAAYPGGTVAEVSTDASGQINSWEIYIAAGGALDNEIVTFNFSGDVIDQGVLACCDPTVQGNLALNFSSPGSWSSGTVSPPQMATDLLNSLSDPSLGLTTGQISSLTDKLDNVLLSMQAGLNKQAINQLNAFISSVQSSEKTGKISALTASTLIGSASAIIAALSMS